MLLDKYLVENLDLLGLNIMKKAGLSACPTNLDELYSFFKILKEEAETNKNAAANMIYQVLYNFVSSVEVRDRHTSPREFEDIFCSIFGTSSTDTGVRVNPNPTAEILKYDSFTASEDWNISTDLCGNKREKADASIGGYNISLKTLKGKCYNELGVVVDSSLNNEINIGSFSYRALFKGILTDDELATLRDRKGGLGSKNQMRRFVLDPIKRHGKTSEFLKRLKVFFGFVYEEDLVIVIKSDYRADLYFVPNKTFIDVVCKLYEDNESKFEEVWYRWENNNLRFSLSKLFEYIDSFKLPYQKLCLNLQSFKKQERISGFNETLNKVVEDELQKLICEE